MSRPVHTLSFDITTSHQEAEFGEGAYLAIAVRARVDGQSPYGAEDRENVFDAVSVLVQGTRAGELDIYTCTCGVAGCAGIHEEVVVEVDDAQVRWRFPEDPFRKRLSLALLPEGEPLVLAFDRAQYSAALADLTQRIEALTAQLGHAYNVLPASSPLDTRGETLFSRVVADYRNRSDAYRLDVSEREAADGALRDFIIETTLPNGFVLRCDLEELARKLVPADVEDVNAYLHAGHRDAVLADPRGAFARLPETSLESLFYVHEWPEGNDDADSDGWSQRFAGQLTFEVFEVE